MTDKLPQIPSQKRVSPCGKITIIVENDTQLSVFHDYLLAQKGEVIDLMVKIQKDEEALRDSQREQEENEEE